MNKIPSLKINIKINYRKKTNHKMVCLFSYEVLTLGYYTTTCKIKSYVIKAFKTHV